MNELQYGAIVGSNNAPASNVQLDLLCTQICPCKYLVRTEKELIRTLIRLAENKALSKKYLGAYRLQFPCTQLTASGLFGMVIMKYNLPENK